MHSRNRSGWGGILGTEDLVEDHERTDPNLENPAFGEVGSEEKTTIARHPPTSKKPRLTLPRPESSPKGSPISLPPPVEFAVEVDQIVQKLEPAEKRSTSQKKGEKKKNEDRLLTKEVILTLIGGLLLVAGTVAYNRANDEPTEAVKLVAEEPAIPVPPPPAPQPQPKPEPEPVAAPEPAEPRKASTPMLSILSVPSGAKVEINGTIYGSTPLIQPSPPNVKSLSIRLLKDNYKAFETILTPNDAGHFSLNATLEKR